LIIIGLIVLSYILIFLLSPKDVTNYTISDTEYWRETDNRLLLKTAYDYNNITEIQKFPQELGDWSGFDYKYPESVYQTLNADILMSRAYSKLNGTPVWIDFINSKAGESFHKQNVCVTGAGWNVDNDSITEFKIADSPNPFIKLYANRLDISKGDRKQVMVYWFMFKKFGGNDAVTMIRISSPVYDNKTTDTFNFIKSFVEGQLFDAMYKRGEVDSITTAESILRDFGNKGIAMMALILLIPVGIVITGIKKKD
jgi:hypothetical protein